MTDFHFISPSGTTEFSFKTDLIPTEALGGGENCTIHSKTIVLDPGNLAIQFGLLNYSVNDFKVFAAANGLQLSEVPIGAPGATTPTVLGSPTLAAPTSFAVAVDGATQITATWTKTPGATGYVVTRSTSSTFASGNTVFTLGDVATKVDTGLTTGTHYYYRIRATAPNATTSAYATDDDTTS